VRPVPQVTGRGLAVAGGLAVLLVIALVTQTAALVPVLVAGGIPVLAAPAMSNARARRIAGSIAVRSSVEPPMVAVGGRSRVRISAEQRVAGARRTPPLGLAALARSWRRGAGAVARSTSPSTGVLAPRLTANLATGRPVTVGVPTGRRGLIHLLPTPTWVRDPLGLFATPGPLLPVATVVVHPEPEHDPAFTRAALGGTSDGDPLGDLVGLRPYVAGDRLALLHWPARARTGTWQVRDFRPAAVDVAFLVLDDRAGVHRRAEYETLLGRTLGVIDELLEADRPVELATVTGRRFTFLPTASGRGDARRVVAGLDPQSPHHGIATDRPGPVLTTSSGARSLPPSVHDPVVAT
jgi:uncharacterized protein (DUF58 family)